ncbi:MAG: hypothetical protein ACQ9MH_00785 [Nitrospinales bacterium]
MLAFSKDITIKEPRHPQEENDAKLKDYMNYQRKLNNSQIVYNALKHGKTQLEDTLKSCRKNRQDPQGFLEKSFPFSHRFAEPKTLVLMLKKLINGQNASNQWYKMNAYYYALVYDCMKEFIAYYNGLIQESSEKVNDYTVSDNQEIDFNDWVYLFFPDLDFHLDTELGYKQYPFAKRNLSIEELVAKELSKGLTREEALRVAQKEFEMEDCSIKILLNKEISNKDLELFHTTTDNPIYEYLTQKNEGSWETLEGETFMDQSFSLGSQLKVTVWKKRKKGK